MYKEKRIKDWTVEDFIQWAQDGATAVPNGTAPQVIIARAIRNEFVSEGSQEEVVAQLLAKGTTQEEGEQLTDQANSPAVDPASVPDDSQVLLEEIQAPEAAVDNAANLEVLGVTASTEDDLELTASQTGLINKAEEAKVDPPVVKTPSPVNTTREQVAAGLQGPGESEAAVAKPVLARNPLPKIGLKLNTETMVETELATYARNMAVTRQITLETAMTEQLRMWNVIQSIFRTRGTEFIGLYGKLLKFVHDNTGTRAAPGMFYETKAMRGILQLSSRMQQREHINFRRIFNLITATCNPDLRALASSQCDLPSALADFTPEQQALITDYYRGV